jgi:curved DNA-binding protein CbpA
MHRFGPNLYQILQVDPTADVATIRAAYRKLAKRYHPDINTSPDAKARMQAINEAYQTLRDPTIRAWYDLTRMRRQNPRPTYTRQQPTQSTQCRAEAPAQNARSGMPWSGFQLKWWWLLAPFGSMLLRAFYSSITEVRSNLQDNMLIQSKEDPIARILREDPSWTLVVNEKFETNAESFSEYSFKDPFASGSRYILDGGYHWELNENQQSYFDVVYYDQSLSDFTLSVDIQKLEGSVESGYGVMFRSPTAYEGYTFFVTNHRDFSLLVLQDGEWIPRIDWTFSPAILPSETNTISMVTRGAHYDFYINGCHVGDLTDTQFSAGNVGLAVGFDTNATGHYIFDNFVLYQAVEVIELRTPIPASTPTVDLQLDSNQQSYHDHSILKMGSLWSCLDKATPIQV